MDSDDDGRQSQSRSRSRPRQDEGRVSKRSGGKSRRPPPPRGAPRRGPPPGPPPRGPPRGPPSRSKNRPPPVDDDAEDEFMFSEDPQAYTPKSRGSTQRQGSRGSHSSRDRDRDRRPQYEDEEDGRSYDDSRRRRPQDEDEEDGGSHDSRRRRPQYEDEEDGGSHDSRRRHPQYEDGEDGRSYDSGHRRPQRHEDDEDGYNDRHRRRLQYDEDEDRGRQDARHGNRPRRYGDDGEEDDRDDRRLGNVLSSKSFNRNRSNSGDRRYNDRDYEDDLDDNRPNRRSRKGNYQKLDDGSRRGSARDEEDSYAGSLNRGNEIRGFEDEGRNDNDYHEDARRQSYDREGYRNQERRRGGRYDRPDSSRSRESRPEDERWDARGPHDFDRRDDRRSNGQMGYEDVNPMHNEEEDWGIGRNVEYQGEAPVTDETVLVDDDRGWNDASGHIKKNYRPPSQEHTPHSHHGSTFFASQKEDGSYRGGIDRQNSELLAPLVQPDNDSCHPGQLDLGSPEPANYHLSNPLTWSDGSDEEGDDTLRPGARRAFKPSNEEGEVDYRAEQRDIESLSKQRDADYDSEEEAKGVLKQASADGSNLLACPEKGSPTDMVQCCIIRDRNGMNRLYPQYRLYFQDSGTLVLVAQKKGKNRTSNYHIFDMTRAGFGSHLSKKNGNYLGKLRSNHRKTENIIFTKDHEKEELGAIAFEKSGFMDQVKEGSQPRKLKILLPQLDADGVPVPNKPILERPETSMVEKLKSGRTGKMFYLETKDPVFEKGNYRLNFHGRVTVASVKNFQLVSPDSIDHIVCQFGKVDEDRFHLDYRAPFNAFQAFAVALCQFNF